MTDRPILFSAPMVRALLAGKKTQTRRIINFPRVESVIEFVKVATDKDGRAVYEMKDAAGQFLTRPAGKDLVDYHFSPRVAVGDHLWVKETWRAHGWHADCVEIAYAAQRGIVGWSEQHEQIQYPGGDKTAFKYYAPKGPDFWRPSIFMPRWASRLTLIVTDVRIERLQDISEADALAEGIERVQYPEFADWGWPQRKYFELWDSINGEGAAQANPWVAAYTFTVVNQNIDEVH